MMTAATVRAGKRESCFSGGEGVIQNVGHDGLGVNVLVDLAHRMRTLVAKGSHSSMNTVKCSTLSVQRYQSGHMGQKERYPRAVCGTLQLQGEWCGVPSLSFKVRDQLMEPQPCQG